MVPLQSVSMQLVILLSHSMCFTVIISCLPDAMVSFAPSTYTVDEGRERVLVCVETVPTVDFPFNVTFNTAVSPENNTAGIYINASALVFIHLVEFEVTLPFPYSSSGW